MTFAVSGEFWNFLKASAGPYLGLLTLMILGIVLFSWIRKRFHDHEGRSTDEFAMLMQFRELQAQGDLTDEEFRSIKSRLIKSNDVPAPDNSPDRNDEHQESKTDGSNPD